MTSERSASPLVPFTAEWIGGDIRGLQALADALYGHLSEITGVTAALGQDVARLTGGQPGWRGPAAAGFAAAWRRDAAVVRALASAIGEAADVVDALAVRLAVIQNALEEQAYVAARYGVPIGTDGRPPPVSPGGPGVAGNPGEQYWTRAYRRAYEGAMADARQAREQAAGRLRELYATMAPGREPRIVTGSLPARERVSRGRAAVRTEGVRSGTRGRHPGSAGRRS